MHLIVDGYNVIRQSPRLQFLDVMDLQAGREALLELLAHYRSRSHHQITVVFDGWQHGGLKESRDRHQGILIIYSRRGERADEVIKRLLARSGNAPWWSPPIGRSRCALSRPRQPGLTPVSLSCLICTTRQGRLTLTPRRAPQPGAPTRRARPGGYPSDCASASSD